MKKTLIIILLQLSINYLFLTSVSGLEIKKDNLIYYTNKNDVEFSLEKYNNLLSIGYSKAELANMTKDIFDSYNDLDNIKLEKTITSYFRETYIKGYKIDDIIIEKISVDEYNKETPISKKLLSQSGPVTYETNYKKLQLSSFSTSYAFPNKRSVSGILTWKKVPKVKSYDIFAARVINGEISPQNYGGTMTSIEVTYIDGCTITSRREYTSVFDSLVGYWNKTSSGIGYSGIGFTAKLRESSDICYNDFVPFYNYAVGYKATLHFDSTAGTTVFFSYQHATTNVNVNSVYKAYKFNNSGLGNVIYFNNSNLSSYYDGMAGLSMTL